MTDVQIDPSKFKAAAQNVIAKLRLGEFTTLGAGQLFFGGAPCCVLGHALAGAGVQSPPDSDQSLYDAMRNIGVNCDLVWNENDRRVETEALECIGKATAEDQARIADAFEAAIAGVVE